MLDCRYSELGSPHASAWIAETVGIPEIGSTIVASVQLAAGSVRKDDRSEELLFLMLRGRRVPVKWWGIALREPPVDQVTAARTPRSSRRRLHQWTILGMKVETLGNAGAYLSNMATGGPTTVNTVNFGTGNDKIMHDEVFARVMRCSLRMATNGGQLRLEHAF